MNDLIDYGAECEVYDAGEYVLKVYYRQESAEYAYERGQMAWEKGLGPKQYGLHGRRFYQEKVGIEPDITVEEKDEFLQALYDEGVIHKLGDFDNNNYGRTKDGRLVLIDFGPMSSSLMLNEGVER